MILRTHDLLQIRRYLRSASENVRDAAYVIGADDKAQQLRLCSIARDIDAEIAGLDQKIAGIENGGGAK